MSGDDHLTRVGGRRLRLTHLDKVLYPASGTTKGEVIDYYTRIAPLLIPHVTGRPVTRRRWPEGVAGPAFLAKQLEPGAPDWVPHVRVEHSKGGKDYPLVDDIATLAYLAQVASLELHVPQWRFEPTDEGAGGPPRRGTPDRIVFDLDPGDGVGLAECAEVARWVRTILQGAGLEPVPVTSGSKGIHVYAMLDGAQTSDQASAVARELARAIAADHPGEVVSTMAKADRAGRVLIDWSQNNAAKTTVAPYSLRGRGQPTVAAPRTWQELDDPGLRHLRFDEVLDRAASIGDPLAGFGFHAGARGDGAGPLAAYIAKRHAGRTPEPVPGHPLPPPQPAGPQPRFVIQEHHATRLHWDHRIEHDGVFVSWAVPRGVPPSSERNALAIMTEDHPLDYGSFEGTIPRGQYGAGTVTIWDDGRYELEKWREDEVIFTVHGRPHGPLGTVRLALVRTQGSGEKSSWLLHRTKTDRTGQPQDARAAVPVSVPAAAGSDRLQRPPEPMLAAAATAAVAQASARRWGEWAEVKWDGIRALGVWDGRCLRLYSRNGGEVTDRYPELTATELRLGAEPATLDGEIVALDRTGRPSFSLLQGRMNLADLRQGSRESVRTPVRYHLFDLLSDGGIDTRDLPLRERRERLERRTALAAPPLVTPPVFDDVGAALATSDRLDLEGVVVKNPRSPYRSGVRTTDWLKLKRTRTQEVVIGGIRPGRGRRARIGSLLVGIPGPTGLQYAGRVGSGFTEAALETADRMLTPLRTDVDPFDGVPRADASDALWVRPEIVGEVEFAEFTPGGILRQARWRGFRADKRPDDVRRED